MAVGGVWIEDWKPGVGGGLIVDMGSVRGARVNGLV